MKTLAPGRAPAKNPPTLFTRSPLLLAALSAFAAIAYAVGWDVDHARSPFRASTLILLGISGALMLTFAIRLGRCPKPGAVPHDVGWRRWARMLFVGAGWSYFVALIAGPQPGVLYVFLAAMASCICVFSWLWIAAPHAGAVIDRWAGRTWIRLPIACIFWGLLVLSSAEVALRLWAICTGRTSYQSEPIFAVSESSAEQPLPEDDDRDESATVPAGLPPTFRIAILGGPTEFGVHDLTAQLGPQLSGVEVRSFTAADGPLVGYRAGLATAVESYRPQMLLVFLAVDGDLTRTQPNISPFDWRSLQVVQAVQAALGRNAPAAAGISAEPSHGPITYRHFLETCSLSVCRKPLDESVLDRWNGSLTRLDELARRCEQMATTLAIVLAPAEFQLDTATLDALCRCAGCTTEQVDLDLPQRRMEAYAAGHHLPCIDLLPYLRASKSLPYCRHSRQWNETGNAIVADAVAQFVMGRYGNQIAASANR
jgi:hypothetical protein